MVPPSFFKNNVQRTSITSTVLASDQGRRGKQPAVVQTPPRRPAFFPPAAFDLVITTHTSQRANMPVNIYKVTHRGDIIGRNQYNGIQCQIQMLTLSAAIENSFTFDRG
jgi:hypothetical protein